MAVNATRGSGRFVVFMPKRGPANITIRDWVIIPNSGDLLNESLNS